MKKPDVKQGRVETIGKLVVQRATSVYSRELEKTLAGIQPHELDQIQRRYCERIYG